MFVGWIKEGEEHKKAFERCSIMQLGGNYLRGVRAIIRKIRFVRLIRRVIEEGIMVKGVNEIYEDGCRILDEMVGGRGKGEEEEEEEEEEEKERYMYELWLLKVRGIEKKLKEDEIAVLSCKVEEADRRVEEEKKRANEEKRMKEAETLRANEEKERADKEKIRADEATRRANEEKKRADGAEDRNRELDNQIKELKEEIQRLRGQEQPQTERTPTKKEIVPARRRQTVKRITPPSSTRLPQVGTSLDGISVKFSDSDKIRREGNTIIHDIDSWDTRHCFIGGEMRTVCVC